MVPWGDFRSALGTIFVSDRGLEDGKRKSHPL